MKSSCLLLAFSALWCAAEPEGWKLVWQDEFDGKELDFTKWAVEENGHGGGNQELQYYLDRKENVRTADGCLIIEARRGKVNIAGEIRQFTSARIRTKRRAAWKYGRFEVRAKLPKGQGLWPAVWLLPATTRYGGWAASGEIDIVEALGHKPEEIHGSLHYGGEWPDNEHVTKSYELRGLDFTKDFNVFALEWEATEIRWYVNGHLYHTIKKWHSTAGPYPAPFDEPFYLIVNLAVGGKWPGAPNPDTVFPEALLVDYIRVYEREPGSATPEP